MLSTQPKASGRAAVCISLRAFRISAIKTSALGSPQSPHGYRHQLSKTADHQDSFSPLSLVDQCKEVMGGKPGARDGKRADSRIALSLTILSCKLCPEIGTLHVRKQFVSAEMGAEQHVFFSTRDFRDTKDQCADIMNFNKILNLSSATPSEKLAKLLDRMPKNLVDIFSSCDGICKSLSRLIYVSSYIMKLC